MISVYESFIFSDKNLYLDFDKWDRKKNQNILCITGFIGSGKSTFSKKLANQYNAYIFELDGFDHNFDTSGLNILENYKKLYPDIGEKIEKKWDGEKVSDFLHHLRSFLFYLIDYMLKAPNKLFIIEGVELFCINDNKFINVIKTFPFIIIGTSALKSYYRSMTRDGLLSGNMKEVLISYLCELPYDINNYRLQNRLMNELKKFLKEHKSQ